MIEVIQVIAVISLAVAVGVGCFAFGYWAGGRWFS